MQKLLFLLVFIATFGLCESVNFDIFYDQNATYKVIDDELDKILNKLSKDPELIDKEFGQKDRLFSYFLINAKVADSKKFDLKRIEKVLKFKPNLNYNIYDISNTTPLHTAIFFGVDTENQGIKEEEILKLIKIILANGADINATELLQTAFNADKFEIFSYLLKSGARDHSRLIFSISADIAIFMGNSGFSIHKNNLQNDKAREFAREQKFQNFFNHRMKFLKKALNFIPLNQFNKKEIELFISINAIIDNKKAIEILLDNGLRDMQESYEFLKTNARHYNSKEILRLIK